MYNQSQRSAGKRKPVIYQEEGTGYSNTNEDAPFKKAKTATSAYTDVGNEYDPSLKETLKKIGKKNVDGAAPEEEKRLRRYRKHAPQSYLEIKERALTQRLTVLNRERGGTDEIPEETIIMAGSTGNVYKQKIGLVPSCDCPHAKKGNQCKHIIYVMLRVLKAPENIGYQLALTSSELRSVLKTAAPIPYADAEAESSDGNRKAIEGDCPICYSDLDMAETNNIVYCKAACGNNVHKDCMASWIAAKAGKPTCPYCRALWEDVSLPVGKVNLQGATRNEDGYLNVASQLGLSGQRDYSSYHRPWARHF
ncbi:hypothetical protein K504DRAFT_414181 [Pleomassaria siparia CBS 279.74]|uniref:Uncharacterized protein n=1 Tax=Pleomassaria siparia CBS 279.74 TaxID=1314801 RepID=A0A6G1JZK0_9PLEO|nr:hypothetical protein K504DRAFT_414181 [Pleomassaria siparia CBS 279.74]